jgi:hypothetical protein
VNESSGNTTTGSSGHNYNFTKAKSDRITVLVNGRKNAAADYLWLSAPELNGSHSFAGFYSYQA